MDSARTVSIGRWAIDWELMPDILHDLPIQASIERVFEAFTTPEGLDRWWTLRSEGVPLMGSEYRLCFGPRFDWRARVTRVEPPREFELELVDAMEDWLGTRVGVRLIASQGMTQVEFWHAGWAAATPHFRASNCCWAAYLRILRRNMEYGETVPYERRLEV